LAYGEDKPFKAAWTEKRCEVIFAKEETMDILPNEKVMSWEGP